MNLWSSDIQIDDICLTESLFIQLLLIANW